MLHSQRIKADQSDRIIVCFLHILAAEAPFILYSGLLHVQGFKQPVCPNAQLCCIDMTIMFQHAVLLKTKSNSPVVSYHKLDP